MLHSLRLVISSVFYLFVMSFAANASEVNTRNYDIYMGDLNGDGYSDYYFAGKSLVIMLHGDIITPIVVFPISFVIHRNGNGYSAPHTYLLSATSLTQKVAQGNLKSAVINTDFYVWSNGGGQTNILLRGSDLSSPSFMLASFSSSSLPLVSQIYEPISVANLSDKTLSVLPKDINQDGKMDIVIGDYVYLADAAGVPTGNPILVSRVGVNVSNFKYDVLGRLIRVEVSNGAVSNYRYDSRGNRTSIDITKGI